MEITVRRYSDNGESTLGLLFVDKKFECYTIEDTKRDVKVVGETRIPQGNYEIKLRDEGGMTKKYASKFPILHHGMLWLQNVPNFKYVYIHIGNDAGNSEGCILVGNTANNNSLKNGFIGESTPAYKNLYKKILEALGKNEKVVISVIDE